MKKKQNLIFLALAVVIMIGLSIWYYFYWQGSKYFTTDNAKVHAQLYTLTSTTGGEIITLNAKLGVTVKSGQAVALVENGPYLISPVNGVVVKCDVQQNQVISPATVIAVVANTDDIYIRTNIEETDIRKIKVGQPVNITLDAYSGQKFKGHVEEIDSATQSALSGNTMSLTTSGTYTKITQLITVKIVVDESVYLGDIIGTNATAKIKIK